MILKIGFFKNIQMKNDRFYVGSLLSDFLSVQIVM